MLSDALAFLSVGIIASLVSLEGMTGVTGQISLVLLDLLVIGMPFLVIHLVWRDRPPTF
jgi:uncharacterized membrane protein YtjA (UPF0391 family)